MGWGEPEDGMGLGERGDGNRSLINSVVADQSRNRLGEESQRTAMGLGERRWFSVSSM